MDAPFDLVIRGGTVADGTGGAPFEADVAIAGGRIATVGTVAGAGREEIAARGRLVTPGFVGVHTHYDGQAIWEQRFAPSSWHGVTIVQRHRVCVERGKWEVTPNVPGPSYLKWRDRRCLCPDGLRLKCSVRSG